MVRTSKKNIVEEERIFDDAEILQIRINNQSIVNIFNDKCKANEFLSKMKLIPNKKYCELCKNFPLLNYFKSKKHIDGYVWQCVRPCTYSKCIRSGSFFEDCRLSFREIFIIFYKYSKGYSFET